LVLQENARQHPWGKLGIRALRPLGYFSAMTQLKDIRTQIRSWSCRGLSLYGKITIIKSFLLPKMLYKFSVLPTPEAFIKQLNTIIYNFLWKGPDKMARLVVINNIEYGGLKLADLETSIKSLRLAWLGRILSKARNRGSRLLIIYLKTLGEYFYLGVITM